MGCTQTSLLSTCNCRYKKNSTNLQKLHGKVMDCLGIFQLEVLISLIPSLDQGVPQALSCGYIRLLQLKFVRWVRGCVLNMVLDVGSNCCGISWSWICHWRDERFCAAHKSTHQSEWTFFSKKTPAVLYKAPDEASCVETNESIPYKDSWVLPSGQNCAYQTWGDMRKHIAMMSLAADSIPILQDRHKTEVKLLHDEGGFFSSIGLQQFLHSSLTKIIKSHSPNPFRLS